MGFIDTEDFSDERDNRIDMIIFCYVVACDRARKDSKRRSKSADAQHSVKEDMPTVSEHCTLVSRTHKYTQQHY